MKCLITGSNGFIGRHLVQYLVKHCPEETLHLVARTHTQEGLPTTVCDLNDEPAVASLIQKEKPDRIYHLAGNSRISPQFTFPDYFMDNFLTTMSLLRAVQKIPKPVTFFFASTMHVYGNQTGTVSEHSAPKPISDYGYTKFLAEQAFKQITAQHSHVSVVIGRLYNCFGPGQSEGFVVPDLCKKIAGLDSSGGILATGSLEGVRRFIDVRDLVPLLVKLVNYPLATRFEVFNIASPHEMTIREILNSLLRLARKNPVMEAREESSPNPFVGLKPDISKLKKTIDADFRPVEETLKDVLSTYGSY